VDPEHDREAPLLGFFGRVDIENLPPSQE